ncbi:MAG: DUF3144 domain-containing protein [Bauldia sp.]|jgi:hypothetical protein
MQHNLAEEAAAETGVDLHKFVRVVDDVIQLANQSNMDLKSATGVNLAILYGLARYSAFVGRSRTGAEREAYIKGLTDRYGAMLRAQFADPTLK